MNIPALQNKVTTFFNTTQNEAKRVFHGRGHCYPELEHICIDWFPPLVLITAYQPIEDIAAMLSLLMDSDKNEQIESVLLQHRYQDKSPSEIIHGQLNNSFIVKAQGLQFEIQPNKHQNSGLFLDVGPLREWLKHNSKDKNVLNLFAYTCSLSVAALAGGAKQVTNVDMSKPSISWGQRNHQLNEQNLRQVRSIPHNIFKSWGKIKRYGLYDTVIIDPPNRQKGSFEATHDYGAVIRKLPKICNDGAYIIAGLNSPFHDRQFLLDTFKAECPQCQFIEFLPIAEEFEEIDADRGLKLILYRYCSI